MLVQKLKDLVIFGSIKAFFSGLVQVENCHNDVKRYCFQKGAKQLKMAYSILSSGCIHKHFGFVDPQGILSLLIDLFNIFMM